MSEDTGSRDAGPSDRDSRSTETCGGCICNGAVVEDSSLHDFDVQGWDWSALSVAAQPIAVLTYLEKHSRTPLPDDAMNTGRALRCLMVSYLC